MSWHRTWLIKCDQEDCTNGYATGTPEECPENWATDGSRHICPDCIAKQREQMEQVVEEHERPSV